MTGDELAEVLADLPAWARTVRLERGLSYAKAAAQIGIDTSYLCQVEQGKKDIRLSTARKIAQWLA